MCKGLEVGLKLSVVVEQEGWVCGEGVGKSGGRGHQLHVGGNLGSTLMLLETLEGF